MIKHKGSIITPRAQAQQGVKQSCSLSVLLLTKKCAVIPIEKGTITFALFWEGHSTDSTIYDPLELQIQ